MSHRKSNGQPAADLAQLLADKNREIAKLKVELKNMQQNAANNYKAACKLKDEIKQAVLDATYDTHGQRAFDKEVVVGLAERLAKWSSSTMHPSELIADIQLAKSAVVALAELHETAMSTIDAASQNLCKAAGMTTYTVAHQVILEKADTAGRVDEMRTAITDRLHIVDVQGDLIWETKRLTLREKRRRAADLPYDVAAQLKSDPTFDFHTHIVPRIGEVPRDDVPRFDFSNSIMVRKILQLELDEDPAEVEKSEEAEGLER